jgi:hypothetical protein
MLLLLLVSIIAKSAQATAVSMKKALLMLQSGDHDNRSDDTHSPSHSTSPSAVGVAAVIKLCSDRLATALPSSAAPYTADADADPGVVDCTVS